MFSLPCLHLALQGETVPTTLVALIYANLIAVHNEGSASLNNRNYSITYARARHLIPVSASQPQQATSDYLSPALYARATAAIVPAAHHVSPAILQFGVSAEYTAESSQEQQHCRLSHGSRFACGAVASLTDGVSMLSRLVGLLVVWCQSEYLKILSANYSGI
jgi:hypothetical protein